jgi:hypothetical protein
VLESAKPLDLIKTTKLSRIHVAAVLVTAALSRLLLILFNHADAGDTPTYELFATNILRGCGLSFSNPSSVDCVLVSGGYLPGYPAFMAMNWLLFGRFNYPILIAQFACYLMALYWLLTAIMRLTNSTKAVFVTGMLLALSPLQVGWFRFVITEPLAIACATWFLAELIISIAERKLRIFHLSLALSASVYIRPDTILMFAGVLLVASYIYNINESIKQILLLVVLTSIPVSGWMIRNLMIGHAPLSMTSDASPKAPGYLFWLDTWVVNEYERADAIYPVWRAEYSKVKIHSSKYITEDELTRARKLMTDLALFDGKTFPKYIDEQFNELATTKVVSRNKHLMFEIYAARSLWLLLNPFSSWGLPLEIKSIDRSAVAKAVNTMDYAGILRILTDYKAIVFLKIAVFIYRILIFAAFFYMLVISVPKLISDHRVGRVFEIRCIVMATALAVAIRVIFFVTLGGLESRYLVEVIPWIECCCALWFVARTGRVMPILRQKR